MALTDHEVVALLTITAATEAEELDCDGFLGFMAQLAEARAAGRTLPAALAQAAAHERLCANCREECDALTAALRDEPV